MAGLNNIEQDGILKTYTDSPAAHYTVKIQLFSMLTEACSEEGYKSSEFEAGGYKWKILIYPNGNRRRNVEGHISIYLDIAGTTSLQPCWEVHVEFRLFLLDQNKRVYSVFEDAVRKLCFNGALLDPAGFDKLMPIEEFSDVAKGYLIDDTCVFGAEVFVCKERRPVKGECISRIRDAFKVKHVWKLGSFSTLRDRLYSSDPFSAGDHLW